MTLHLKFSLGFITLHFLDYVFDMLCFDLIINLSDFYHQLLSFFVKLSLDMMACYTGTISNHPIYP